MKSSSNRSAGNRARGMRTNAAWTRFSAATAAVGFLLVPTAVWAQVDTTGDSVCGFFQNINGLLNLASIAVVTIAVIFAGYQIAFAHKRIADVAPILIGGLLIGAAAQIAGMLLPEGSTECLAMVVQAVPTAHA